MNPRRQNITPWAHLKGLGSHAWEWAKSHPGKAWTVIAFLAGGGLTGSAAYLKKDPRNALVYVFSPVISEIRAPLEHRLDRQGEAIVYLGEVLDAVDSLGKAKAVVDAIRAEEKRRQARRARILGLPPASKNDSMSPFDASEGFTASVIAGDSPMFRRSEN